MQCKFSPRPFVQEFLAVVSGFFHLVLYSCADEQFLAQLVKSVDPHRQFIHDILGKNHCLTSGYSVNRFTDIRD